MHPRQKGRQTDHPKVIGDLGAGFYLGYEVVIQRLESIGLETHVGSDNLPGRLMQLIHPDLRMSTAMEVSPE